MVVFGLTRPWLTLKRLLRVLAVSQLVSPLVASLAVLVASNTIRATTVDTTSTDSSQSVSTQPPVQQEVVTHKEETQCCGQQLGGNQSWRCPKDLPTPSVTAVLRDCAHSSVACSSLPLTCLQCYCDYSCEYGKYSNATCTVTRKADCQGDRTFTREFLCSYCYLTPASEHRCTTRDLGCRSVGSPTSHHHWYVANCSSSRDTLCLGKQVFSKRVECDWTEGYSWRTALILSITLGGFGADRFYLGHWQEGIGKLFSFGGLGVWTLVDVVLVSIGYIGPADGSLYI